MISHSEGWDIWMDSAEAVQRGTGLESPELKEAAPLSLRLHTTPLTSHETLLCWRRRLSLIPMHGACYLKKKKIENVIVSCSFIRPACAEEPGDKISRCMK